jgi:hypothetical protein
MVLGMLDIDRVPWWAAQWLVDGHDGQALRELAGLGSHDSFVHDLLPAALAETGVELPPDDVASAMVIFSDLAAMCLAGRVDERWVAQEVEKVVIMSDYSSRVIDLPLGQTYGVADAWTGGWGPTLDELRATIRDACREQLNIGRQP